MEILNAGIPSEEYEDLIRLGRFSDKSSGIIATFIEDGNFSRLVAIGDGTTYAAAKTILRDRITTTIKSNELGGGALRDADAIIVTTSPIHYDAIVARIATVADHLPVLLLFKTEHPAVRLILETQPRSGTEYTMKNLVRHPGLKRGSVYPEKGLQLYGDGLLFYTPGQSGELIVKAHFTKPLHYPQYRYCKTAFLISYFFDAYYSWAIHLLQQPPRKPYVLRRDSLEWATLAAYFSEHLKWLEYIQDKFWYRYEDYYIDFDATVKRLGSYMGSDLGLFVKPRENPKRTYWSDDYASRFEPYCFETLLETFTPFLLRYYPEKAAALKL